MKTNAEYEKEFIAESKAITGQSVEEWMENIRPEQFTKQKEVLNWLKTVHGINHMNANFIAGIYMNNGKPVYDPKVLYESHFEGKEHHRPLYEAIELLVKNTFESVQVVPTKGYISFRNAKEFAVAKINKAQIRVGLDLSGEDFNEYTQKAKSLGTMPRISHMVEIFKQDEVNAKLREALTRANEIVN